MYLCAAFTDYCSFTGHCGGIFQILTGDDMKTSISKGAGFDVSSASFGL
jgi:hypothetical protein